MATVRGALTIRQDLLDAVPDRPLRDLAPSTVLLEGRLEEELPILLAGPGQAGAVAFTARAGAGVRVTAFVTPDQDPDGVLGAGAETAFSEPAWVKTGTEAWVGAAPGALGGEVAFGLRAGASVALADYRLHRRSDRARAAVLHALSAPRFALRLDDVLALVPGEALVCQLAGTLTATVTLAWSDILAAKPSLFTPLLPARDVLVIAVRSGAALDAWVKVDDEFRLVFSGVEAGQRYRVAVKKGTVRGAAVTSAAGFEVGFVRPEQVEAIVDQVLEALLGFPAAIVREALGAAGRGGELGGELERLAKELARRLGLTEELEDLAARVRARVEELAAGARRAAEEAARSKIAAGFRYEYLRVSEESSLFQAVLSAERLREFHTDLVLGRLAPLLDAARSGEPDVAPEIFLGQHAVRTERSWGFSLGIGRWRLSGFDRRRIEAVTQTDLRGCKRVAYKGFRGYEGEWLGQGWAWSGDLAVAMDSFSAEPVPRLGEYDFGLHLLWQGTEERSDRERLREQLDTALVWGALEPEQLGALEARLVAADGPATEFVTQVTIGDTALRRILEYVTEAPLPDFSAALAAAVPPLRHFPGRADVRLRRRWYEPLWRAYLRRPDLPPERFAEAAGLYFERQVRERALAFREAAFRPPDPYTFAGIIHLNGDIAGACLAFQDALRTLARGLARNDADDGVIANVFAGVSRLWTQSFLIRAAGAYLCQLAAQAGVLGAVERSVTVSFGSTALVVSGDPRTPV